MSYNSAHLDLALPGALSDVRWGIAWARFMSGDRPRNESDEAFSDTEWTALLNTTKVTHSSANYYRPHAAVVRAFRQTRDTATLNLLGGINLMMESAVTAAGRIRAEGRWIDDAISDATGNLFGGFYYGNIYRNHSFSAGEWITPILESYDTYAPLRPAF